jgi:SNF2 family DNA or RNA helicase
LILVRSRRLPDGQYALTSPYDHKFVEIARTLPGLHWDKAQRVWIGHGDSVAVVSKKLAAARIAKVIGDLPLSVASLSVREDERLRDYQKLGVSFLENLSAEGCILADDMGLGKTRQTLVALEHLPMPAVIVCPAIIKREWVKEGAKLGIDVLELHGTKPPPDTRIAESDGVVVTNYDVIHAWLPLLKGAQTLVFDEGHAITNEKSRRSKVCKELATNAEHKILLSGTPFTNRPIQLWNVVETISPGRFGSYIPYAKRYCEAFQEEVPKRGGEEGETQKVWNVKGASNLDELHDRLLQFMLRRTKLDVQLELPPMTRQTIEIDVAKQARDRTTHNIPDDLDDEWMRWALAISARDKIDSAVELAMNHLANNSSVVVTCHRHDVAREVRDCFAQQGIEVYLASGELPVARRMKAIEEASQNTPCVVVTTTHAVGEGVNTLTFVDVAIIVELDYVPRWLLQFESRFHRPGQTRNVLIQYLIGIGTIDEIVRDRVLSKLANFEKVIGITGTTLYSDLGGNAMSEDALLAELRDALREIDT